MTVDELERLIPTGVMQKMASLRITLPLDALPRKNRLGKYPLFDQVPAELIDHKPPNIYTFLVKVKSLRMYIDKQRGLLNG